MKNIKHPIYIWILNKLKKISKKMILVTDKYKNDMEMKFFWYLLFTYSLKNILN